MPEIEQYDGVIVDFNSINNEQIRKELRQRLEACGRPCVGIIEGIEGGSYICYRTQEAFQEMMVHLIENHHYETIHYISGPIENEIARERLEIF